MHYLSSFTVRSAVLKEAKMEDLVQVDLVSAVYVRISDFEGKFLPISK